MASKTISFVITGPSFLVYHTEYDLSKFENFSTLVVGNSHKQNFFLVTIGSLFGRFFVLACDNWQPNKL